jgi:hypothetical protein
MIMLKKFLMILIALTVLAATPAKATVIYDWRTVSVERGVEMSGRIGFSEEAWFARKAVVDFLGFAQSPLGSPGDPRFIYPDENAEGEADPTPDVVDFGVFFSDMGIGGAVYLTLGENRISSRLQLDMTFDSLGQPSGGFSANSEPASSHFVVFGSGNLWRAEYGSDGACQPRCQTTGFWELDQTTNPTRVAEPGSLLLVLSGVIGLWALGLRSSGRPAPGKPIERPG